MRPTDIHRSEHEMNRQTEIKFSEKPSNSNQFKLIQFRQRNVKNSLWLWVKHNLGTEKLRGPKNPILINPTKRKGFVLKSSWIILILYMNIVSYQKLTYLLL